MSYGTGIAAKIKMAEGLSRAEQASAKTVKLIKLTLSSLRNLSLSQTFLGPMRLAEWDKHLADHIQRIREKDPMFPHYFPKDVDIFILASPKDPNDPTITEQGIVPMVTQLIGYLPRYLEKNTGKPTAAFQGWNFVFYELKSLEQKLLFPNHCQRSLAGEIKNTEECLANYIRHFELPIAIEIS